MKNRASFPLLTVLAAAAMLVASPQQVGAQVGGASASAPDSAPAASTSQPNPAPLSAGVEDILKLSRAHVSDDTIVAFIGYAGKIYNPSASEIVFLQQQGVTERVLNTMLNQRQKVAAYTPPVPPAQPTASAPQYAPAYTQPQPAYVETVATAPASTVYVIPATPPSVYSYGYYPYSSAYYGYSYPGASLTFGFGSGYYGGYYGGIYYGGGYGGRYWAPYAAGYRPPYYGGGYGGAHPIPVGGAYHGSYGGGGTPPAMGHGGGFSGGARGGGGGHH